MTDPLPRLLAIVGSGETSPTMSKVHRDLFERLGPPPVPAVILDTPVGFQENADEVSARAVSYFRDSVRREISVASYRQAGADPLEYETMLARLAEARYVFCGPGSPSYALQQWRGTRVPALLAEKLREGGCITFASAAAVTLGPFALPVYEIYKVGQALHWLQGLDLMAELGLRAVVVPHFDNTEGGTHDTRYCYIGERRLSRLEAQLPDDVFVLGVDEHTVCIFDLEARTATVAGLGTLTVRHRESVTRFPAGSVVPIPALAEAAAAPAGARTGQLEPVGAGGEVRAPSSLLAEVDRLERQFREALAAGDAPGSVKAALELEEVLSAWSHDTLQSDHLDRGRGTLRAMLVRLGEAAQEGARPEALVGPFVEALLEQRRRARGERRWEEADAIRKRLVEAGVEVRDTAGGSEWALRSRQSGDGA